MIQEGQIVLHKFLEFLVRFYKYQLLKHEIIKKWINLATCESTNICHDST